MSYNPTLDYANNAWKTNSAQVNIAGTENSYQDAILGKPGLDQDQLRQELFIFRAILGELRLRAQEIVEEQRAEKDARKGLLELTKA